MINCNYYGMNPLLKVDGIYKKKKKFSFFLYNSIIRGVEI